MGNFCACSDNSDKLASVENETDNLKEETTTYKAKVEELESLLKATKKKAQIGTQVIADSLHSPLQKKPSSNDEVGYTSPQNELIALKLRVKELQNLVKKHSSHDIQADEEVGDWVEVMSPDVNLKNNQNTVVSSPVVTSDVPLSPPPPIPTAAIHDNEKGEHSKDNETSPLSPTSVVTQTLNDGEKGEHIQNKSSSAAAAAVDVPKANNTSIPVTKIK